MNVAVIVATCGDDYWRELAAERAAPSAFAGAAEGPGRMALVAHYPDLTVAEARNRAAAEVPPGSDWLCFLDADDELEPGYLDAMFSCYQQQLFRPVAHTEPPLLIPAVRFVRPGALSVAAIPNRGRWPRLNEAVIGTLVSRALFEKVGGFRLCADDCETCSGTGNWTGWSGDDEHTQEGGCPDCCGTGGHVAISIYEDWDLWLRCTDAGAKRIYVEDAIYRAHVNPNGRNYAADPKPVYDAIWRDHMKRTA